MPAPDVPISKTKIILPRRRAELLSRPRLLDILYERLDRKLIIVSAPAGYGKTSLLIDLAHNSELTFCWLGLDPLDREPQRFVAYLVAALAERFPQFGGRSRSVLNNLTSLEAGSESLVVTLVNEIHDEIPEHFVLVLDDFHLLDESPPIHALINRFVRLIGENCHLILASRTLPELPDIPLLVARDEVGGLDFSDLAFRPEEIQALISQNQHVELSDVHAVQLEAATEGWITGIQFADLNRVRAGESPFRAPRGMGVSIFDFLGRQVLDQQPPELRAFLLRSALLEEFDAGLCDAVLGPLYAEPQDWSKLLDTIRQKNLFALPVGANGQWLRYHHLFRDYLQDRYRKELPHEINPTLKRLAEERERRGEWEAAYQLYRQLGNADAVADLIEHAGSSMYQNAMLTLETWLNDLAPSVVKRRPGLLSLRGAIALMRDHPREGVGMLDAALAQFEEEPNRPAQAVALVRRGHGHRFLGEYQDAIADATGAMGITAEDDDLQGIYADALRLRGLSRYRQGHTLQAIEDLQNALDIDLRINDPTSVPNLWMETGMAQAALGEYRKARNSYDKALEFWRRSGNLFSQANVLNNAGFLNYQLGEYERAAQSFEEGMLCAQQCGYKRMEALISISMGDLYAEIEDFEIAAQNYSRAQELTQQLGDRFLTNYLLIAEANLALLKREPARARGILDRRSAGIHAGDSNYEYGHLQLARGRLSLQEGNPTRALPELNEAKRCFTEDGREMETIWSSVWLAAAYSLDGQPTEALREIGAVLQNPNQVTFSAVVAARQASNWLEILRSDREARALLRGLFEKADRLDDQLPAVRRQLRRMSRTIDVPAPTLTIHAFGRGKVWANGKLVSGSAWQTQAVRELFFYFLAMNKPVSKEQVGSVLWPDTSEPSRLKLRFKNEIYRLRRAVGQNSILYEDEYYQLNPAIDHEYDVEAFEAYLERARTASGTAEKIVLYQKAVDLVGGSYLEDIGALWVVPERERLHQAFLAAALTLSELYLGEGQATTALEMCQRILEREATSEAAYRLKMHIHRRMGDKASLIRTYRECEESLRQVFGMPPSDETQDLYHKLIA